MLLWLWYRLTATALIGALAWKPQYAVSTALKRQQQQQTNKKKQHKKNKEKEKEEKEEIQQIVPK